VSPRSSARAAPCSTADAARRLRHAHKFIEKSLGRLLNLKAQAHYGLFDVAGRELKAALRQANDLVAFAEAVMHG
jgi:hypothetical protein